MDWLVPEAKKLGWPTKATYYSHADYNKDGRKAWRAAMFTTYNFVKRADRQKRERDQQKAQESENTLQQKRARLRNNQRSLAVTNASGTTEALVITNDTGGSASANASAVPEACATAPPPVTANVSAVASTTATVTAGAATGPEAEFDVETVTTTPSETPAQVATHDTGGSASVNASAVPEAYATTPPPVTANASVTASTAAAVTAGAVTGPEPRFDVPTTITLLHADLLQLCATIHQLGYVTGHPSHGYADAYAQQAL